MPRSPLSSTLLALAAALGPGPLVAQPAKAKSGEQVYRQVCTACHAQGVAGAPKLGDAGAWKPLIAEGQHILTAHAFVGVRAMPPRGGAKELSLEDFARAVAWMARNSGGDWKDPDAAMTRKIRAEAGKRLDAEIKEKQALRKRLAGQVRAESAR